MNNEQRWAFQLLMNLLYVMIDIIIWCTGTAPDERLIGRVMSNKNQFQLFLSSSPETDPSRKELPDATSEYDQRE